jgi:hypothetical protein
MALTTEKVTVKLTYNSSKKRYSISIDKVTAWLDSTAQQQIMWYSDEADLRVDFNKNGCPFVAQTFFGPKGTTLCSTGAPINTTKQAYGYALTITPSPPIQNGSVGAMAPIVFDPQVVVTPDGPPGGGGGKKRGKKKSGRKKKATARARRKR